MDAFSNSYCTQVTDFTLFSVTKTICNDSFKALSTLFKKIKLAKKKILQKSKSQNQ